MTETLKFEDYIADLEPEVDELMFPEEADELEKRLEEKYGHINLTEEESDNMYANIMRQIMRLENIKNNKKK